MIYCRSNSVNTLWSVNRLYILKKTTPDFLVDLLENQKFCMPLFFPLTSNVMMQQVAGRKTALIFFTRIISSLVPLKHQNLMHCISLVPSSDCLCPSHYADCLTSPIHCMQLLLRFLAIMLTASASNFWILISAVVIIIMFLAIRWYYLNTSRDVKRLEAIGQSVHSIPL